MCTFHSQFVVADNFRASMQNIIWKKILLPCVCRLLHLILLSFNVIAIQGFSTVSGTNQLASAKKKNATAYVLVASQVTLLCFSAFSVGFSLRIYSLLKIFWTFFFTLQIFMDFVLYEAVYFALTWCLWGGVAVRVSCRNHFWLAL